MERVLAFALFVVVLQMCGAEPKGALLQKSYEIAPRQHVYERLRQEATATKDAPEIGEACTDENLKKAFACLGVTWPEGSSATIKERDGRLFVLVTNTAGNLGITEKIVARLTTPPPQISIEARIVEYDEDGKLTVLCNPRIVTLAGNAGFDVGEKRFFPNGQKPLDNGKPKGETICDGFGFQAKAELCEAGIRVVGRAVLSDILSTQNVGDYNEAPSESYTVLQTVLPFAVVVPREGGYVGIPMAERDGKRPELELTVRPTVPPKPVPPPAGE